VPQGETILLWSLSPPAKQVENFLALLPLEHEEKFKIKGS
jgi:hypothetical protein